ncbi:UMP kinase [Patescibacteria group bacterium]|nr:UMP kinase [Patescibacteria group bacterium]
MGKYKIISLGGSIIIPSSGFDVNFLKKFRDLIVERVKKGDKFILVVGGGSTCRAYQDAAKQVVSMANDDLDWLGIKTTIFNAEFVRFLFKDLAHKEIVTNPTKKIKTSKAIIIAAGWKPGCSTDHDAVLLAKTYGAKEVVNASNISYVYTADPKKDTSAKPLPNLTWNEMKKIVGETWSPGANVPFDPKAVKTAARLGLVVRFVKGTDLAMLQSALLGNEFAGSIIQ